MRLFVFSGLKLMGVKISPRRGCTNEVRLKWPVFREPGSETSFQRLTCRTDAVVLVSGTMRDFSAGSIVMHLVFRGLSRLL